MANGLDRLMSRKPFSHLVKSMVIQYQLLSIVDIGGFFLVPTMQVRGRITLATTSAEASHNCGIGVC